MKNTYKYLFVILAASAVSHGQQFQNSQITNITLSSGTGTSAVTEYTYDINLGGVKVADGTIAWTAGSGPDSWSASNFGASAIRGASRTTTQDVNVQTRMGVTVTPLAGFQLDGMSMGNANAANGFFQLANIASSGSMVLDEAVDYFTDGVDGQAVANGTNFTVDQTSWNTNGGYLIDNPGGIPAPYYIDSTTNSTGTSTMSALISTNFADVENAIDFETLRWSFQMSEIVPEPSSSVFLGLGGLAFLARRKRA